MMRSRASTIGGPDARDFRWYFLGVLAGLIGGNYWGYGIQGRLFSANPRELGPGFGLRCSVLGYCISLSLPQALT